MDPVWKIAVTGLAMAALTWGCTAPQRTSTWVKAPGDVTGLGAQFHVTPAGTPAGDGSMQNPWDIQTAMMQPPAVKPGDTIWIHGGDYPAQGSIAVHLQGEKDKPIIVRNWNDERATLRARLDIANSQTFPTRHVWIWGLEIQRAGAPLDIGNTPYEPGLNTGIKIINCVAHDCTHNGMGVWGSAESEVYGCLVYNSGYEGDLNDPNARGHGHGFYIQSNTHQEFFDNIVFRQFCYGFQIYGSEKAHFNNVTMQGNTFFNNGELSIIESRIKEMPVMHIAGGNPVINPKVIDNCVYSPAWAFKATSNIGGTENAVIEGNYLVSPGPDKRVAMDVQSLGPNKNMVMNNNTFIGLIVGFTPDQFGKGNVHLPDRPTTGKKIVVRANKYEEGRANIAIFNWDKSDKVAVDVKNIGLKKGDAYEIRDAQDFYGKPVVTGTYDAKPISIPMTGLTVAAPIGRSADYKTPPHTAPEFGVFVIMKTAAHR